MAAKVNGIKLKQQSTCSITSSGSSSSQLDFSLSIRPMAFDEVAESVQMFSDAGLHDSPSTVEAFYQYDPEAFLVAVNEDKGQVIGCCAAPVTTHQSAFLGLYVVDKRYQRAGIGLQLFNRTLEQVGERNCGLGAIPSKFEVYKNRAGFKVEEGCSMVINEGVPRGVEKLMTLDRMTDSVGRRLKLRKLISVEYDEDLVQAIVAFDEKVHLDNRDRLLRLCLAKEDTVTYAVLDGEEVLGYGCIRPDSIDRAMPGPLYAVSDDIAEVLLGQLLRCDCSFVDQISLFSSTKSPGGMRLATLLGLPESDRCAKLYTKFVPPFNYDLQYCCHTPDFAC